MLLSASRLLPGVAEGLADVKERCDEVTRWRETRGVRFWKKVD